MPDNLKMIDMLTKTIHDLMRIRNELVYKEDWRDLALQNKTLAIGVYAKKYKKTLIEAKKIVEEYLDS